MIRRLVIRFVSFSAASLFKTYQLLIRKNHQCWRCLYCHCRVNLFFVFFQLNINLDPFEHLWMSFVFDEFSSLLSRADTVYEDMKQRYGPQGCYLLKMNSRTFSAEEDEQIPDPWSQYLHKNNLHNQVSTAASSTCSNWPGPMPSAAPIIHLRGKMQSLWLRTGEQQQ